MSWISLTDFFAVVHLHTLKTPENSNCPMQGFGQLPVAMTSSHNPPFTIADVNNVLSNSASSARFGSFVIILLPLYSLSSIRMPRLGNKRKSDQLANVRNVVEIVYIE